MLPMFKREKVEKRKAVVAEFNTHLSQMFEQFFVDNYPSAREELLRNGIPEESVDQKLAEIKQATQQRMIIEAQRLLKEELLTLTQEQNALSTATSSHANDLQSTSVKMNSTST
jgi:hypothetical protein